MTVQYNQLVLTGGPGVFFRLLLKWRGCVFKLIYVDLIIFMFLYTLVSCIYRFALPENAQRVFERVVIFVNNFQAMIPVAFILGFYINLIFSRFWTHFMTIPWALRFSMELAAHLPGITERARLMRRTCLRYVMASLIITATRLHLVAKKRFPTFDFFVSAGVLTEEEVKLISEIRPVHVQPFVPLVWATSLVTLAEKEKLIRNHHALALIVDEINSFRQSLLDLFMMDYVCVPLVYTQVVTLSVYSYFAASLVGRQYIIDSSPHASVVAVKDLYFPFFTFLEFIIYVGWLKVAETLVNPMGEDDEDFDINEIIDFNWKACWCIVDGMRTSPPAVVRDIHWHQSVVELPHTEESKRLINQPFLGSMFDINVQCAPETLGSVTSVSALGRPQDNPLTRNIGQLGGSNNPLRILSSTQDLFKGKIHSTDEHDIAHLPSPVRLDSISKHEAHDERKSSDHGQPSPSSHVPSNMMINEPIKEEDEEIEEEEEDQITVPEGDVIKIINENNQV